jgi:hypothetical protein
MLHFAADVILQITLFNLWYQYKLKIFQILHIWHMVLVKWCMSFLSSNVNIYVRPTLN